MKKEKILVQCVVNGEEVAEYVDPRESLLDMLRNHLGLTSVKRGCEVGECGACTVLLDDQAVNACLVLAQQVDGHAVMTIEGLAKDGILDPLQQAFVDCGAIQCGFCSPGMLLSAKGLLLRNPHPTAAQIKEALEGNLCRCTGYVKIIAAVQQAAGEGSV